MAVDVLPGLRHDMALIDERRKSTMKDIDGVGRWGVSIPAPVMSILEQYKPELFQDDIQLQNRAWLQFIKHSDSKPFRVSDKQ